MVPTNFQFVNQWGFEFLDIPEVRGWAGGRRGGRANVRAMKDWIATDSPGVDIEGASYVAGGEVQVVSVRGWGRRGRCVLPINKDIPFRMM